MGFCLNAILPGPWSITINGAGRKVYCNHISIPCTHRLYKDLIQASEHNISWQISHILIRIKVYLQHMQVIKCFDYFSYFWLVHCFCCFVSYFVWKNVIIMFYTFYSILNGFFGSNSLKEEITK